MKPPLLSFFCFLVFTSLLNSQEPKKNTWSHKDRSVFVEECLGAAKAAMSEDSASQYCYCMLYKVEARFRDVDEMGRVLTKELLETPEWQKIVNDCFSGASEEGTRAPDGLVINKQGQLQGGKYYALVIGVSDYNQPKLDLDHPLKDAKKIREILLKNYLFADSTTRLLSNPTRNEILDELYRLRKVIGKTDNLLIFYAGHGYWDEDIQQGYWWAKDAVPESPSTWLSNSDLREQIRGIRSAHTLLISDACFSGGIFKTRGGNDLSDASKDIQLLYKMPSRRAMTSGTLTSVPDRSVFLEYLLKRLAENQSKFLSSQQLFDSFRSSVINNSKANAVPQDGVIAETGDDGGDFIFILRQN